jgi:hypothetical protein
MEETTAVVNAVFPRKVRPPIDIAVTTLMAMGVVFLISQFSVETASAVGCFAGFCVAAWNWLRMGRRRKALAHFAAAFGVYILILVVSVLIAIGLALLFVRSVPTVVEQPAIQGLTTGGTTVVDQLQNQWVPRIGSFLFNTLVSVLVVVYLYRATARDVRQYEATNDTVEFYNFFPLLVVAAISVAFITLSTAFVNHIRIAQVQNHVYCELLQPGMTSTEVDTALNELGPHWQVWFEDALYPSIFEKATHYRVVEWDNARTERDYDLSLWLGYDANDQLVWTGRYWSDFDKRPHEEGCDTITCPWTLSSSLTAR